MALAPKPTPTAPVATPALATEKPVGPTSDAARSQAAILAAANREFVAKFALWIVMSAMRLVRDV